MVFPHKTLHTLNLASIIAYNMHIQLNQILLVESQCLYNVYSDVYTSTGNSLQERMRAHHVRYMVTI